MIIKANKTYRRFQMQVVLALAGMHHILEHRLASTHCNLDKLQSKNKNYFGAGTSVSIYCWSDIKNPDLGF